MLESVIQFVVDLVVDPIVDRILIGLKRIMPWWRRPTVERQGLHSWGKDRDEARASDSSK